MRRGILSSAILIVGFLPFLAYASCPCPPKTLAEKYSAAHMVFLGRLLDVREIPGAEPRSATLTFSLLESWKGTGLPSQDVVAPVSIDTCGFAEEQVGTIYLVFARAQEGSGELRTSVCDGTDTADALASDLRELRLLYQPAPLSFESPFPDVPRDHAYAQAFEDLRKERVISGFPDGSLRPEWSLTRAEATKIVTLATQAYRREDPVEAYANRRAPFSDVDPDAWYYPTLLRSVRAGYIRGFTDGTFRPSQTVTVAEAASMVARAMDLPLPDVAGEWYESPLRAIGDVGALPPSLRSQADPITRGEILEMLWRLTRHVRNRDSALPDDIIADRCEPAVDPVISGVDLRRLRAAWISLFNAERVKRGLAPYVPSADLDRTAAEWSVQAAEHGEIDHQRPASRSYYDYPVLEEWFKDRGVTFPNIGGKTFTESIGWGMYQCDAEDCTADLFAAIQSTFSFFLSEEGKGYRPHFNAIVDATFHSLGMGVAVSEGQYFITTHIGTEPAVTTEVICEGRGGGG